MGRQKLSLELIPKEKSRLTTFHKRKNGLLKKISEFKVLCDVDACVIIYGPDAAAGRPAPAAAETWPADPSEVGRIIQKYKDYNHANREESRAPGGGAAGSGCGRRNTDLLHFYQDRKKKLDSDLARLRRKIGATRFPTWDDRIDRLDRSQLGELCGRLDRQLREVRRRLDWLKGANNHHQHHWIIDGGGAIMDLMSLSQSSPPMKHALMLDNYNNNNNNNNNNIDPYLLQGTELINANAEHELIPLDFAHHLVPLGSQVAPIQHQQPSYDMGGPSPLTLMLMNDNPWAVPGGGGYGDCGCFGGEEGLDCGGLGSGGEAGFGGGAGNMQCLPWKGAQYYSSDPLAMLDSMIVNGSPAQPMHY